MAVMFWAARYRCDVCHAEMNSPPVENLANAEMPPGWTTVNHGFLHNTKHLCAECARTPVYEINKRLRDADS